MEPAVTSRRESIQSLMLEKNQCPATPPKGPQPLSEPRQEDLPPIPIVPDIEISRRATQKSFHDVKEPMSPPVNDVTSVTEQQKVRKGNTQNLTSLSVKPSLIDFSVQPE